MTSSNYLLHINSLPIGILQEIFNYLPFSDRKTAALVCRLWGQEAFSGRLLANVRLHIYCDMINAKAKTLPVLWKSSRPHRNVAIRLCRLCVFNDVRYAFVLDILDKFGTKIEEFIMNRGCSAAQLKGFADRMPNLQRISADVLASEELPVEPLEFPVLDKLLEIDMKIRKDGVLNSGQFDMLRMAPNIQQLSIFFDGFDDHVQAFELLKVYASQLRSLDLSVFFNWVPIDKLRFEKLKILKLRGTQVQNKYDSNSLCKLFQGLPELESVHLDFCISETTLAVICRSCPKLKTLYIRADDFRNGSLKYLDDFPNLQIFRVNHLHVGFFEKSKPVTTIKELHVDSGPGYFKYDAYVESLFKVFPNVSLLKIENMKHRIMRYRPYSLSQGRVPKCISG